MGQRVIFLSRTHDHIQTKFFIGTERIENSAEFSLFSLWLLTSITFFVSYFLSPQTTPTTPIQTLWECLFWARTTDIYVGSETNQSITLTQKSTPFLKWCFGLHANYSKICRSAYLNNSIWSHIHILLNAPSYCKWHWPDISSNEVNTGIYY